MAFSFCPQWTLSDIPTVLPEFCNLRHCWHFGSDNSQLWGLVLCIVGCLAVSLVSTYLFVSSAFRRVGNDGRKQHHPNSIRNKRELHCYQHSGLVCRSHFGGILMNQRSPLRSWKGAWRAEQRLSWNYGFLAKNWYRNDWIDLALTR